MVRFRKLRRLQQSKQLKNSEYNRLKSNLSQEAKRRAIQEEWEMKQAKIEQLKSELAAVKAQPSAHLSIILPNAAPSNIPLTFCKVQRHCGPMDVESFESFQQAIATSIEPLAQRFMLS